MAEYHKEFPVALSKDALFAVFQHVQDALQDAVRIVDDGTKAVYIDPTGTDVAASAFWNGTDILTANHFGDGSYLVLEPVAANAGGRRWQIKVTRSGTIVNALAAPNGGFSTLAGGFGANVVTHEAACVGTLASGDSVLLSSSDLEVYGPGGASSYTYWRMVHVDASTVSLSKGAYAGGYIPSDLTNDTEPFLFLAGYVKDDGTSASWTYDAAVSANFAGRSPVEDGQAVTQLAADGYATLSAHQAVHDLGADKTRSGVPVESPFAVCQLSGRFLGHLGPMTMAAIGANAGNRVVDNGGTRMVINGIALRWT